MSPARVLALTIAILANPAIAHAQPADILLIDGKVVTVDDRFTVAQALAIRGQRIVKVGTTADLEPLRGPATRMIDVGTPDAAGGKIEKYAVGKPTGFVDGAAGVAFVAAKIPLKDQEAWLANTRRLVTYLNSIGITAWSDAGGRGMSAKHYEPYRYLAERGELDVRVYWLTIRQPVTA